jgi:GT2 family glycosyltransferase
MESNIAVAICTRNRGKDALIAIASLQQNPGDFPIFIVDQSTEKESKELLESLSGIVYLPTNTIGLSIARNIALEAARQLRIDILLFTDDDCTVPTNYVASMASEFAHSPTVALVYANVLAGQHDSARGIIPTYERHDHIQVQTLPQKKNAWGIGAAMGVRVASMEKIGGFDPLLGAGATYPAGEDWDIALRALLLGYSIIETNAVSVMHHGFRSYEEAATLNQRDGIGGGAAMGKLLRLRPKEIAPLFLYAFWQFFFWPSFRLLLHLERPRGIGLAFAFLRGVLLSWHVPTEPSTLRFKPD